MARGRLVATAIALSDKFAALQSDSARMLYLMTLPHVDKEGRIEAKPALLRAQVAPLLDLSVEDVRRCLCDMQRVGLVEVYEVDSGHVVAQVTNWSKHNLRYEQEKPSQWPPPEEGRRWSCGEAFDARGSRSGEGSYEVATGKLQGSHLIASRKVVPRAEEPSEEARKVTTIVNSDVEVEVSQDEQELPSQTNGRVATDKLPRTYEVGTEHLMFLLDSPSSTQSELTSFPPQPPPRRRERSKLSDADAQAFMAAWNDNRGALPGVISVGKKRRESLARLAAEHGGVEELLALFTDAVRAVAADEFWVQRQFSIDTLLTGDKVLARAEQWRNGGMRIGETNRKSAMRFARALEAAKRSKG